MRFTRLSSFFAAAALALSAVFVAGDASADPAGAQSFVEQKHGMMQKLVDDNAPGDQIRAAIGSMVDYDELAKRTLGNPCPPKVPSCTNHWDAITPAQRAEVTALLKQLVEKNFHKNLLKTKNYDVSYKG